MIIKTPFGNIDTTQGIDLSIEFGNPNRYVKAWYVDDPTIEPVKGDGFIGDVAQGSPVNFRNVLINPHGQGTHTETYGHISADLYPINEVKIPLLMNAYIMSVQPEVVKLEEGEFDKIVRDSHLDFDLLKRLEVEALLIRTLPNTNKLNKDYSSTNPPYFEKSIATKLREIGIKHFLVDLPSVDREQDEGKLSFHHEFWNYPSEKDLHRTITEFIYIPDEVEDGFCLLQLQVAPLHNDAAPSRPVIYRT